MRPKILIICLVLVFLPQLVRAEENPNIIRFELSAEHANYEADAYSLINVKSEEIFDTEGNLLPDGTLFAVSLLKVDDVYGVNDLNLTNYFELDKDLEEDESWQLPIKEGKLDFSFKAGVIAGHYTLAATHTTDSKQYYGEFSLELTEFTPLVLGDVDIVPERPDVKDNIKVSLESYTPNAGYEIEFSPINLIEKEGKDVFQLNIWAKRVVDPSEEISQEVQSYDRELPLPKVSEVGEYTLRVYENGTVMKEHVFNIESASTVWIFTDVNNRHWAYNYIKALVDREMVRGYEDGSFRPDDPITRAEFLKVVLNGASVNIMTELSSDFDDVPDTSWYKNYIMTAKGLGIISGYEDATFRPESPILRQEATKIILEAFQIPTIRVIEPSFDDVPEQWLTYIETGVVYDFWHGRSERIFEPRDYITRAEVTKIVDRIWDIEQ